MIYSIVKFDDGKYGARNNETGEFLDLNIVSSKSIKSGLTYDWPIEEYSLGNIKSRFLWLVRWRIRVAIKRNLKQHRNHIITYTVIEDEK